MALKINRCDWVLNMRLTMMFDCRHVHIIARTIFSTKSTMLTMSKDFCRCRCEYVKYERSSDRERNEFVNDGHRIPLTTLPRLNAEYASLLNGCRSDFDLFSSAVDFEKKTNKEEQQKTTKNYHHKRSSNTHFSTYYIISLEINFNLLTKPSHHHVMVID